MIVFVGYILAKIIRGIIEGLVRSLSLQQQVEKVGMFKNSNLAQVLGNFVFAIVIITALIVAFEALGIDAISQPATAMLHEIMYAIPNIIAAGLILILAYVVSRFVAVVQLEGIEPGLLHFFQALGGGQQVQLLDDLDLVHLHGDGFVLVKSNGRHSVPLLVIHNI